MNSILAPSLTVKPTVVNGPKVGDILVSHSGYEACIAHFAKVVGVTKSSVKIVSLRSIDTYTGTGGMEWTSMPDVNGVEGEVETKRFKPCGDTYKVKDTSYCNYLPWSGKPSNCYNYH